MKSLFHKYRNTYTILFSVVMSFAFVALAVSAATTISTNINTGGTLTVSGITTANGALHASSTLVATGATTLYGTTTISAQPFVLGLMATNPNGQTEGTIFYDSTSKIIKLYDGSSWFTVATSTGGAVLSGSRIQFSDLTTNYVTFGTTTPIGASVMTLEATSTLSIPLSLRAFNAQTSNIFQVQNVAGTELFALDDLGNASTSDISVSGNLWVDGYATTSESNGNIATEGSLTVNGAVILGDAATDNITITGNATTSNALYVTNTLDVGGTASTTKLIVGGDSSGGTIAGIVFGFCSFSATTISASSTTGVACTGATGITTSHRVFVSATSSLNSLPLFNASERSLIVVNASSTAVNTIGVDIYNASGAATTTGQQSFNFIGIR